MCGGVRCVGWSPRRTRGFHKRHLQIGQRIAQHHHFFIRQVAARFFLNHLKLVDKHPRQVQVDLGLAGFWTWNLAKKQRCILRLHHYELDEALGHLAGLNGFLDFSHMKK